jgi:hypothetical protein
MTWRSIHKFGTRQSSLSLVLFATNGQFIVSENILNGANVSVRVLEEVDSWKKPVVENLPTLSL